jgi:DNA replication protein DnaC
MAALPAAPSVATSPPIRETPPLRPARHRRSAQTEIDEKHADSIKYRLTIAKRPLAKELAAFDFAGTPSTKCWGDLGTGAFKAQHNVVLVGGTGTG